MTRGSRGYRSALCLRRSRRPISSPRPTRPQFVQAQRDKHHHRGVECYTLLLRRLGIGTAHQWLGEVLQGALLVAPTINDLGEAGKIIVRYSDQPMTLFDTTLAVLAWRLDLPVWTFDHHFDLMRVPVWR